MSRIWVIGNGPSLKETPLHLLKNETTFAMNKIFYIFPYTDWRPSMYLKVDYNSIDKGLYKQEIAEIAKLGIPMYLWDKFKTGHAPNHPNYDDMPDGVGELPNVTWIPRCKHHYYMAPNSKGAQMWHLPEICTGYTGLSAMLQLSVLLGYDEIYLLGTDLNFSSNYTKNHFVSHYTADLRDKSAMDTANIQKAHEIAKKCCPIPIYNATIGGTLEVYPRIDMIELLKGEK